MSRTTLKWKETYFRNFPPPPRANTAVSHQTSEQRKSKNLRPEHKSDKERHPNTLKHRWGIVGSVGAGSMGFWCEGVSKLRGRFFRAGVTRFWVRVETFGRRLLAKC